MNKQPVGIHSEFGSISRDFYALHRSMQTSIAIAQAILTQFDQRIALIHHDAEQIRKEALTARLIARAAWTIMGARGRRARNAEFLVGWAEAQHDGLYRHAALEKLKYLRGLDDTATQTIKADVALYLDEYIKLAKHEAEAAGVQINL